MKKLFTLLLLIIMLSSCDNSRQLFIDDDGHYHKIETRSFTNKINVGDTVTIATFYTDNRYDVIHIECLGYKQIENQYDTLDNGKIRSVIYHRAFRTE